MLTRPDVLVLGAGGVLGEAWMMGLLAGIEDGGGFDLRRCEYFVGTSAGAIVAAHLAAGRAPRRPSSAAEPDRAPAQPPAPLPGAARAALEALRRAGGWGLAAGGALAPLGLALSEPAGALARAAVLARLPRPTQSLDGLRETVERSRARFDGRLRVVAVDRRNGRRVVFGTPGAPPAAVAEAVAASCSVPWLFAPVRIGRREYVDGGAWSPTNLDVAPAGRETHVLCLYPLAAAGGSNTLLMLARSALRSSISIEALALRARGASVQMVSPNLESAAEMGADFMQHEPRHRVAAAGYRQGVRLASPG